MCACPGSAVAVGYLAHSLALIADGFHLFSDIIALIIALYAIRIGKKPPTYVMCQSRSPIGQQFLPQLF